MTNNQKAALFKTLNSFTFAGLSVLLAFFSNKLPATQILFLRAVFGSIIVLMILLLIKKNISISLSKNSMILYVFRAIVQLLALFFWIHALKDLGVNEAIALGYTTPMWKTVFANIFLRESFTKKNIKIIICNTICMIIILQPKFEHISYFGCISGIFSTMLWAVYDIICKKQTLTEHYIAQAFYSQVFVACFALPFAIYYWQDTNLESLLGTFIIASCGIINIIILFLSYRAASVIFLIPFGYTRLIFAALLSYFVNGILPTYNVFIGTAIIIFVGIYCYITSDISHKKINI